MNFKKIFNRFIGGKNEKELRVIKENYLNKIKEKEPIIASFSYERLRSRTEEFKIKIRENTKKIIEKIKELEKKVQNTHFYTQEKIEIDRLKKEQLKIERDTLELILPEAFALVKDTARRFRESNTICVIATPFDRRLSREKNYVTLLGDKAIWKNTWDVLGKTVVWDMVHYDVQLIGGVVIQLGKIAEMATGEGKTLVATLPIYLNALVGRGVHIVTVNDYLAKRDAAWMAPIMEFHGLRVDCIDKYLPNTSSRKKAYEADITYGTNSEFGFDYLRDNMAKLPEEVVQRDLHYAIVDEVDSVLIDEARTPLIISGSENQNNRNIYDKFKPKVVHLIERQSMELSKILKEACYLLKSGDKEKGGFKLLQVYRGLPKFKTLIKVLQEENVRFILQKTEDKYMRDNNREMPKVDYGLYFVIDEKNNSVDLSEKGIESISKEENDPNFFLLPDINAEIALLEKKMLNQVEENFQKEEMLKNFSIKLERLHILNQLLKAYTLFERDVDYVLVDNQVKIVDKKTGRIMEGRRYSDGLHQAIEAKENVKIESSSKVFATISLQNYFRIYENISGMTGTAATESSEFWQIYKLEVVVIPTNFPVQRVDSQDFIFKTMREKYNAIVNDIFRLSQKEKRPVLIGTSSIEVSELLSRMLISRNIPHNVLNAKQHKKEAEIISKAGIYGVVTISTNMAGRGTDIKLSPEVKDSGLAILGTERHDSRRIDRQLRGRAGRQGDPGSSQFYVSIEDNLIRLFSGSSNLAKLMDRFGHKEGDVIQHPLVTRSIENAQKKVEENNFSIRKRLLEYDDVMNKQREIISKKRQNVLFRKNIHLDISMMLYDLLYDLLKSKEVKNIEQKLNSLLKIEFTIDLEKFSPNESLDVIYKKIINIYTERKESLSEKIKKIIYGIKECLQVTIPISDGTRIFYLTSDLGRLYESRAFMEDIEKMVILEIIDEKWKDHINNMDNLRSYVQNSIYEQKDPLLIYKREAFHLFQRVIFEINKGALSFLFRVYIPPILEK
ncbi:MAG TPA: preprotein translocase subunit SecA [Blattabacteriaceae bacterium]